MINAEVLQHVLPSHPGWDPDIQLVSILRVLRLYGVEANVTRLDETEEKTLPDDPTYVTSRLSAYRLHLDALGDRFTVLWPDQRRRDAFALDLDVGRDRYPVTVESPFYRQREAKDSDTLAALLALHLACLVGRTIAHETRPTDPCLDSEGVAAE